MTDSTAVFCLVAVIEPYLQSDSLGLSLLNLSLRPEILQNDNLGSSRDRDGLLHILLANSTDHLYFSGAHSNNSQESFSLHGTNLFFPE